MNLDSTSPKLTQPHRLFHTDMEVSTNDGTTLLNLATCAIVAPLFSCVGKRKYFWQQRSRKQEEVTAAIV